MSSSHAVLGAIRHDWTLPEVEALFALPLIDLLLQAQRVHRSHHEPNTVQMSTLLSIKTGACPEDCAYCPQSVRYETGVQRDALLEIGTVRECAERAKAAGATRFAWAPRTARRRIASFRPSPRWCARSARSGSRAARRSAC
ncbi:biotin synthase [mine drainage metagenome]|uniref:Biotin synthase n=1 Tax=mine drainage metagenome TaxID=410659 RepID=T0YXB2_9ZZZZ